jgi:hypothetical protein
MKEKINSYIAVFIIVVAGSLAATFIMKIVEENTFSNAFSGSESKYSSLEQSILNQ